MLHRLVGPMSLACTGLVSGQTFSSAHWFFPGNHERQMAYEQALNRVPEAAELARWHELMDSAPVVDEDFERDVEASREAIGPPDSAWPS